MKSLSIVVLFVAVVLSGAAFAQTSNVNIIPKPNSMTPGSGTFTLSAETRIVARDKEAKALAAILDRKSVV